MLDDHQPRSRLDGHQNLGQLQETLMGARILAEKLTRAKSEQPIRQQITPKLGGVDLGGEQLLKYLG